MKRIISLLLMVCLLGTTTMPAFAATPRVLSAIPTLSFSGSYANCGLIVNDDDTNQINAVIKLWDGSLCKKRWEVTEYGFIDFQDSVFVTRGRTYTLTVDLIVNGVSKPRISVENDCP